MRTSSFAVVLLATTPAFAASFRIDPAHSSAAFEVSHLMVSTVVGTMGKVSGTVELDEADFTKMKVDAKIDVNGLDTREPKRDADLRSKEFLDAEQFPLIGFVSTKVEKGATAGAVKVSGNLTIHGVTKPVTLDATVSSEIINPMNKVPTRAVQATTTINRKDFGISKQIPMGGTNVVIGEEVKVTIRVELGKTSGASAK